MVVNHNIPALSTYNVVNNTSSALQKSINKLSTGLRINSAADDAAGLAISEKMRAQVRGLDQAVSNSQDGISMIQTAEGALSETHSILQRMRELSVQAANDTLTQQDRGYIQEEVDQLREEITRIGNTTQFNKKKLLNGDAAALWSSSDSETKAIIKGGLRSIDQFGQKKSVEGNYNIRIKTEVGQGEVQKSDIFSIKHADSISNESINKAAGVDGISVHDLPAGTYTVKSGTAGTTQSVVKSAAVKLTGVFNVETDVTKNSVTLNMNSSLKTGASVSVTVTVGDKEQTFELRNMTANTGTVGGEWTKTAAAQKLAKEINGRMGLSARTSGASVVIGSGESNFRVRVAGSGAAMVQNANSAGTVFKSTAATKTWYFEGASGAGGAVTATAGFVLSTNVTTGVDKNASILFEVTDVNTTDGTVTLKASVKTMEEDGTLGTREVSDIVLTEGKTAAQLGAKLGLSTHSAASAASKALTMALNTGAASVFHVGSKFVYNVSPNSTSTSAMKLEVEGRVNKEWPEDWTYAKDGSKAVTRNSMEYTVDTEKVAGKDIHLQQYYLNENTGEVREGDITLQTNADTFKVNSSEQTLASFDANYIGETANGGTRLRDLDKFWDSQGNFLLTDPQTITITQGDGKTANVTLYANDTLDDVAKKFNDAVANTLGQAKYLETGDNGVNNFVTFTSGPDTRHDDTTKGTTSQSVAGTFLIRSLAPGATGQLRLSGDENVINAFSLNTIQDAKESRYTASITDAHTGASIASNVQVTGNKLIGVINENVDVEFDAMAGVKGVWNDAQKKFSYKTDDYQTTLHLSDNTTVFQIGANEGEDMGVNIGDMRAHALGLDEVLVTNRDSAARSITVIDNAIDKVSMQRAKLGAYQNRLEHTINNLTTASENLTAAESRIRDTDMAKEMMNFSKLQIMLQAGNSMLAQANQLPQNVLSLVR
jgi:flagellin